MTNNVKFDWVPFYRELADKLLSFKDEREQLVINVNHIFEISSINMPTLEKNKKLVDIDPFTVFGLFNKTSMREENRVKIINAVAEIFSIAAPVPTSFDGIPVLNPQNATYYYFLPSRDDTDIDDLWDFFEAALKYTEDMSSNNKDAVSKYFDLVINKKGNGNSKITMGLYWIAPDSFLNLDSRNEWYIYKSGKIPEEVVRSLPAVEAKIPAEKYFEIADKLKDYLQSETSNLKNFRELSYEAWIYSEKVNQENALNKNDKTSNAEFHRWFKPILKALRDLGGSATPAQTREKIIENEELTQEEISETRGKNNVNKFTNEVAFARNYLADTGYIDRSVRGVWLLTELGKTGEMNEEIATDILRTVRSKSQNNRKVVGEALADDDVETIHYWLYSPGGGAAYWDEFYHDGIMAIGWEEIGDLSEYVDKNEMQEKMKECYESDKSYKNSAYATWQFVHELKPGDIVFAKKGMHKIVGRGVVLSDYEYDASREYYNNVRQVKWTDKGEWDHPGQAVMKTLTDITPYTDYVEKLDALFDTEEEDDVEENEVTYPPYGMDDFLSDVFMEKSEYETLVHLVKNKMNVIIDGAPGVGKTYVAKRLAYSIMGVKDTERVMMVQFHQSYSYEDFIMGIRPTETGYELRKGVFYNFCKTAETDRENDYFFIIDEINRGNLSKIFGELFMLLEKDKRNISLQLLYANEKFSIPDNVYIIGMMNTADRSLAMLDYALRRRFAFFEMRPGFETTGFRKYRSSLNNTKFDKLIDCVENLNSDIALDESLGEGFCIGHSYFCNLDADTVTDDTLSEIVKYELIPLLKEYWFDEPTKVKDWSNNLRSTLK